MCYISLEYILQKGFTGLKAANQPRRVVLQKVMTEVKLTEVKYPLYHHTYIHTYWSRLPQPRSPSLINEAFIVRSLLPFLLDFVYN